MLTSQRRDTETISLAIVMNKALFQLYTWFWIYTKLMCWYKLYVALEGAAVA